MVISEKASLFSVHFNSKQRRNSFQQPHSCHPCPVLRSVAFQSSFVRILLLGLDPCGMYNPDGLFSLILQAGGLGVGD